MRVVVLAGGTGGAKLADGFARALPAHDVSVIVNTGDDVERHGLLVMPDHDSVLYLLAGMFDEARGWGVVDETWSTIDQLAAYGEDTWFRLGDRDLALHIARTARLRDGAPLTEVVLGLQHALGVATSVLPMADEPVRTEVRTVEGWLPFQDYFVRLHQAPDVHEVRFAGIEAARPTRHVEAVLAAADFVVIGPSNPIVSIGPILEVPGMRELLADARERGAAVVAVSPIVGGRALKGPADRMLASLGFESSARSVAERYVGVIDGFVFDVVDAELEAAIAGLGLRTLAIDSIMADAAGRQRVAEAVLAFGMAPAR